jgi:hypothetical protein
MFIKIECPSCQSESSMSLIKSSYKGPFRCWKCRGLFTIEIKDNKLTSYEALSEEMLKKQQDKKNNKQKRKK